MAEVYTAFIFCYGRSGENIPPKWLHFTQFPAKILLNKIPQI